METLSKIAKYVGNNKFSRLQELRVNRGNFLSLDRTKYHLKKVSGFYVLSHNSTSEKAEILRNVAQKLEIPGKFLGVEIVEK